MQSLGCQSLLHKGAAACSNWAGGPAAVQRYRHPRLAAHVAQPATEPAFGEHESHIPAVSAALLGAQQLLLQQQTNGQWLTQQDADSQFQQRLNGPTAVGSTGVAAAAAAAVAAASVDGIGWPEPGCAADVDSAAARSPQTAGVGSNGRAPGSNGFPAAHFSWQAGQLGGDDEADQHLAAAQGTHTRSRSSSSKSSSSSSGSRSQVTVDSRGYYIYTAADLQRDQQLPPAQTAGQEQSQGALQQQDQLQHQQQQQLHQQQQQLQPPLQQHQQQLLQRAKAPQQLDSRALGAAQFLRDKTNRRLTARIRDAQDLTMLRHIMRQYEGVLNHFQVAALFVKLTKLVSNKQLRPRDILALPSLLPQVLSLVEAAIPDFGERGISNCIHCLAVLELNQERQLLGSLLAAAESLRLTRFTPQGLANITWALGALHINPGPRLSAQLLSAAAGSLNEFSALELAQVGWGAASLRIKVDDVWLQRWRSVIVRVLPELNPQGLSMLLWSTARLTEAQHVSATAAAVADSGSSSNGGSSSHGSVAGAAEQGWLRAAEHVLQQQLRQHTPHSVSICLWSLGKLGYRPRKEVTRAALYVVQPKLRTVASPSDLVVLLYSLAAFGYRPSRSWVRTHGAAVRRLLPQLGVRRIANLLWAHAKLGLLPEDQALLWDMVQMLHNSMHEANARDLANSLWALATLGHTPHRGFLAVFGAQAQALVHDFSPQEISNLLWAYAKLGVKPPHMLLVALWESIGVSTAGSSSSSSAMSSGSSSSSSGSTGARLSAFKPQELAMLVWALAVLKVVPGKAWWDQFLQSSYHKMSSQTPQSLASIIWSLSELQLQPPPAWLYHWAAAVREVLGSMNPVDLGQVAAALQGRTFQPLQLPKLEALLVDVLERLAALEVASGAYSKAAMHMLLRMQGHPGRLAGSSGNGRDSSSSSSSSSTGANGSSSGGPRSRAVPASSSIDASAGARGSGVGRSSGGRIDRLSYSNGPSVQGSAGPSETAAAAGATAAAAAAAGVEDEVERLKEYLVKQSIMEGSSSLDDVPELDVGRWSDASDAQQ